MNSLAKLALAALLLGSSVLGCAQNSAVAYTQDGALFLATDSGTVTRTLKTRIPIGDFSISRDATKVVFVPAGVDYGGTLYMVDAVTGQLEQLTGLCPVQCNGEVYSDPEFSPDGKQLVFSVHGAAHGDLVEASGPIAVMEFSGRQIRKLKSTVDIGGRGPAFANSPHWSADGKKILLNFEIGAAFTDSAGQTLRDISALLGEEWSNARGWLGTQCVIYVAGKDAKAADKLPLQVINLKTTQKQQLSDVLQSQKHRWLMLSNSARPSGPREKARKSRSMAAEPSGQSHTNQGAPLCALCMLLIPRSLPHAIEPIPTAITDAGCMGPKTQVRVSFMLIPYAHPRIAVWAVEGHRR